MIKIENAEVYGIEAAIRGMRNPYDSHEKSDSGKGYVGKADAELAMRLVGAGTDHGKLLRFIHLSCDITAPLYWWKEFDTYKVGTTANSESTMHTIMKQPFCMEQFSTDKLSTLGEYVLKCNIEYLNAFRNAYIQEENADDKKKAWYNIIQLLPESWMQKRTVDVSYQTLRNMYFARRYHKLDEWRKFCEFVETLDVSEILLA